MQYNAVQCSTMLYDTVRQGCICLIFLAFLVPSISAYTESTHTAVRVTTFFPPLARASPWARAPPLSAPSIAPCSIMDSSGFGGLWGFGSAVSFAAEAAGPASTLWTWRVFRTCDWGCECVCVWVACLLHVWLTASCMFVVHHVVCVVGWRASG